jgi:hypothetical protein
MKPAHVLVTASFSLALSLAALGCSKGSGAGSAGASTDPNAPKGGSCTQSNVGLCTEYSDNPGGIAEGACTSLLKGTYSKGSCSRDNTIGSCKSKDEVNYYYFGSESGPWTEDAADECKTIHEGTFTPTPGAAELAKQKALPTPDHILASCVADATSCEDHYGDPIKLGLSKSMCEAPSQWNDGKACPTDGLVGTCLSNGTAHRYYAAYLKKNGVSLSDLASQCSSTGMLYSHFYPVPGAATPPPVVAAHKGGGKKGK